MKALEIFPLKSALIQYGDDLWPHVLRALQKSRVRVKNRDVLVVSSKVVALSQGRVIEEMAMAKAIKDESDHFFGGAYPLSMKDGVLIPAAGIDRSNIEKGKAILWPKNSHGFAVRFRKRLIKHFRLKQLGVLIIDSHCQPLRLGTTALALACAGIAPVTDMRGAKDLFGKKLQVTQYAVADGLATAANLVMGEGNERVPFAVVRNTRAIFTNGPTPVPSIRPADCLFAGIYSAKLRRIA